MWLKGEEGRVGLALPNDSLVGGGVVRDMGEGADGKTLFKVLALTLHPC